MKILMLGRGVITTIYGWALERAGHDVEFLVRPGRAAELGRDVALDLIDARQRPWGTPVTQKWQVRLRETLETDHDVDLIVLSVAHHRLADAAAFLAPHIGNATVLVFGSIWTEPTSAVAPLPIEQLAWGFPQAGGGFDGDGVLRGALTRKVVFGTLREPMTARERAVRAAFTTAGFTIKEQPDIRGWLWIHFVADAGMHAQALQLRSMSELVGATARLRQALLTSRELLPVLQARGVDLSRHRGAVLPFQAPSWPTATALSWLTAHVALARASLAAHTDPHAEEPRAICRDALAEAHRLGVPVPRLEASLTRSTDT